ncbi:MAG: STAS domain-containing protein [Acidobacteriota bacterium]
MKLDVQRDEGVVIVRLDGKLTIGEGDVKLRDKVVQLLESGEKRLVLDLKGVRTIDSSGLGELIRCKTTAEREDAVIKLLHVEDKVEEILEMTRLIGVFDNYNDQVDAVASFRS